MAFEKGKPKTGGRAKGTPNKRQTIFEALEKIHTEDGQPIDIVKMFINDMMEIPAMQRTDAWLRFMEFVFPKQKNLEVTGEMGIKVTVERYLPKDE